MPDLPNTHIEMDRAAFRRRLLLWHDRHREQHPWRVRFAQSKNPYFVWLSEIMLQQTVIKAALPAYERFLQQFPSVSHLANAETEAVRQACRGLGYYRRFHFLHQAAKILHETKLNGAIEWPKTREGWQKLPGIGPYTSAAISSICFHAPHAVVDGNVERIICRLLNIQLPVNLPELKPHYQRWAQDLLDVDKPGRFNEALMELGQKICRPQQPQCQQCPVNEHCISKQLQSTHLAPQPKISAKPPEPIGIVQIIPFRDGQYGLWRRPPNARFLKGTLGWPTGFVDGDLVQLDSDSTPSWPIAGYTSMGEFKHSITHHRITSNVVFAHLQATDRTPVELHWVHEADIESTLVSSLDAKALKTFLKHKKTSDL